MQVSERTQGDTSKRANIVGYWNTELLSSLESSTSHADPNLAYLDNAIENARLQEILASRFSDAEHELQCIDVGAGYGRFAPTLTKTFSNVCLLEAAPNIYARLQQLWGQVRGVNCVLGKV